MTDRELLNPPGVHAPQAHYAQVARVGDTLYISGQLAIDRDGRTVGIGDVREQTRQCYRNLAAIVEYFGGTLANIVKTTIFLTHWSYRPIVSAVRDEFYPSGPYPTSTMVVVQS
ncbi:MAG TPA: RidA family protein, partial [Chloroflexota bacterium]|nr:RidA family protein [Chloroflexota bacterium]